MELGPPNPELKMLSLKYGVEFKKSFGLQGGSSFSVKSIEFGVNLTKLRFCFPIYVIKFFHFVTQEINSFSVKWSGLIAKK